MYNYLRRYLSYSSLNIIEVLEISELNYDTALKLLNDRFGNKERIVNHHMKKLLNLSPVCKSSNIMKLQKTHNDIGINVWSLNRLEPQVYTSMVLEKFKIKINWKSNLLKLIPVDLNLEYNRQNIKISYNFHIDSILNFIQPKVRVKK